MEFPDEILAQIFLRLPIQWILRAALTCKAWRLLIQSPWFVDLQLNYDVGKKNKYVLLYSQTFKKFHIVNVSDLKRHGGGDSTPGSRFITVNLDAQLVGSSNGLVCLVQSNNIVTIHNLSTGMCSEFTEPVDVFGHNVPDPVVLFGFGYVSSARDYKVLRLFGKSQGRHLLCEAQIPSLRTGAWTSVSDVFHPMPALNFLDDQPTLLNEVLHWNCFGAPDRVSFKTKRIIYSFDLAEEKWGQVPFVLDCGGFTLGVLGGCLSVLHTVTVPANKLDVWVMKNYGVAESWTKLISVQHPLARDYWLDHLNFVSDEEILLRRQGYSSNSSAGCEDELVMFNMKTKTYLNLSVRQPLGIRPSFLVYLESLVSPHC